MIWIFGGSKLPRYQPPWKASGCRRPLWADPFGESDWIWTLLESVEAWLVAAGRSVRETWLGTNLLENVGTWPDGMAFGPELAHMRRHGTRAAAIGSAPVDFSDQITKIYHQGAMAAQLTFEQPCGGHHTFEHRDEMRWDRIRRRS